MIKVFIPVIKGRVKTKVRGFWYSQDTKRTYYDYLKVREIYPFTFTQELHHYLENLKAKYNQESIAFIDTATDCLSIYYNKDRVEKFNKRAVISSNEFINLKAEIKRALSLYGGVTVYIKDKGYVLEIYYKGGD